MSVGQDKEAKTDLDGVCLNILGCRNEQLLVVLRQKELC
jgi:hypothetical protein